MIPAVRIAPQVLQVHRAAVLHLLGAVAVPALVQAHPAEVDRVLLVAVLHRAAAPAAAPAAVPAAVLLILQVPLTDRIYRGAMESSDFPVVDWFCIRLAVARMTMMMILQMMTLLRMMIPVVPHRAVVPAALTAPQALLHPQAAVGAVAAPVLTQVRPAEVAQAHRAAVAVPAVPAVRTVPQAHQMTLPQAPETPVKTARN